MTIPNEKHEPARVSLIGAGPGDTGLITVKGLARLREADVVVYDALANPALLAEARADAEQIDVGKRAGQHKLPQDQINQLLVDLARQGKHVARLKGGDPYLFGRGAEEAAFLGQCGIVCEVIPGITSGIAAPMMAGIPVTHRQVASSVTFVTGHEDPTKDQSAIDYAALAQLAAKGGTLCFYMGVGRLPGIASALREGGVAAETPAAVVQWGATPKQRDVRGPLGEIAARVADAGIAAPAIILIGQVAGLDLPGLDFFTARPLFGQTILNTRSRHQASELTRQLVELGADVVELPTIELVPPADWAAIDAQLRAIGQQDWLVLTSTNGVAALADRLFELGLDARHLAGLKIAAIGDATAQLLRDRLGIAADLVPARYVAESLVSEMLAGDVKPGAKCLLLRADIARPALPRLLEEGGAVVTDLPIYQTRRAESVPAAGLERLRAGEVDWITFTSSSTAANLLAMLGDDRTLLQGVRLASIGPVTTQALGRFGLVPSVEAEPSTVPGLVAAMARAAAGDVAAQQAGS